jgi:hypothetical protein
VDGSLAEHVLLAVDAGPQREQEHARDVERPGRERVLAERDGFALEVPDDERQRRDQRDWRDLREDGRDEFVERRVESDSPIATYYSLTEKGESLCPVFDEIECWASTWQDE